MGDTVSVSCDVKVSTLMHVQARSCIHTHTHSRTHWAYADQLIYSSATTESKQQRAEPRSRGKNYTEYDKDEANLLVDSGRRATMTAF